MIKIYDKEIKKLFSTDEVEVIDLFDCIKELVSEKEELKKELEELKNKEPNDYDPEVEIPNIHYENIR